MDESFYQTTMPWTNFTYFFFASFIQRLVLLLMFIWRMCVLYVCAWLTATMCKTEWLTLADNADTFGSAH